METKKPATYDDLLEVPDTRVAELVDGVLYASPRPASKHGVAASMLGGSLITRFQRDHRGPGGWWIMDEPELHFGSDVLVPDIAGWRRERMPEMLDVPFFTLAPDWVCEVLSPGTARLDRAQKLPKYAAAGVGHAWLVDPIARTLEVFRREEAGWLLVAGCAGEDRVRAEPFAELELELGTLWGERSSEPGGAR